MPKKRTIVIGLIVLLFLAPGIAAGESLVLSEYQIKAGFLSLLLGRVWLVCRRIHIQSYIFKSDNKSVVYRFT